VQKEGKRMREIIYRGYDLDDVPVYGCLVHTPEGPAILCREEGEFIHINPGEIGQYTGLEDNNGISVFEGDHLVGQDLMIIVMFRDGAFWVGSSLLKDVVNNGWVVGDL